MLSIQSYPTSHARFLSDTHVSPSRPRNRKAQFRRSVAKLNLRFLLSLRTPSRPALSITTNQNTLSHQLSHASQKIFPLVLNRSHHHHQPNPQAVTTVSTAKGASAPRFTGPPPARPPTRTSQRNPRIQVSSLLTPPQSRHYLLEVIQHPIKAAEFGSATLSRLPMTPLPVAQLIVRDSSGRPVNDDCDIPFLVAYASLYGSDGQPLDMGSDPNGGDSTPQRLLYGTLVATPQFLVDLQGNSGMFFLFPDISVRWRGRYQLGVTLVRLSQYGAYVSPLEDADVSLRTDSSGIVTMSERGTVLAEARTHQFDVVRHEEYSAPPTTRLMQAFSRQGARTATSMYSGRSF